MSIVPKEAIEVIAQSIGINNLSQDVSSALAPDVEYHMREIVQEAIKCMRHSKRTILTTDDVHGALHLMNVEPIYGFASRDPLQFKRAIGNKDLFYIDDKDVDFKAVIEAPLPKAPLDTVVVCHWLAIEGVQPAIPENAPLEVIAPPDAKNFDQKVEPSFDIKLPIKHVLSKELQLYFNKITELTLTRADSALFKEALISLATDSGLHPLVPYFTHFIADEVSRGLGDYPLLFSLMRIVGSLIQNPHINIEPYLHQLMPSVVTCIVAKRLGNRFSDDHWKIRDFSASLVASICKKFGHVFHGLQTRLTKTLLNALLDPKRSLTQHYGAIQGLSALGPNVVRLLILPNLEPYLRLLEPEMLLEKQKNELKRHEAWRVYGALLCSSGQFAYRCLRIFPSFSSPGPHAALRTKEKVATTTRQNKRKALLEPLEQQQQQQQQQQKQQAATPKKIAGDQPEDRLPGDDSTGNTRPSAENQTKQEEPNCNSQASINRSAILNLIWKDDLNSGHLLQSLLDLFGEGILPFIPAPPEMGLFF